MNIEKIATSSIENLISRNSFLEPIINNNDKCLREGVVVNECWSYVVRVRERRDKGSRESSKF